MSNWRPLPRRSVAGAGKFILAGTILICLSQSALSCGFDTDCEPGSHCAKASGSLYGVCMGGLFPGNQNDQEPVYAPLDVNGTYGKTCSFDTDCGPGSECVKDRSIYGVCTGQK